MRTEEGSDTEESGDVVNVGPIGFAEGLDGSRETEIEGDRDILSLSAPLIIRGCWVLLGHCVSTGPHRRN